jgi:transketolase
MVDVMTTHATGTDRAELLDDLLAELTGDEKHAGSAHSTLDVLRVLFERVLRHDPAAPDDPARDRFLLSKGHGPAAYYAVLAASGYLERAALGRLAAWDAPLGHHPDRLLVPGVEISSGSLGHGLPIAVGRALALRASGHVLPRVVVLLGDAELDEGSNHEAIALAGRLGLDRLVAVVVDNRSATHGWPGGIEQRFALEGWTTAVADGRDHDALEQAFGLAGPGCPHVVVAVVADRA